MPSIRSVDLPRPLNWQDFETMTRDALAQKWNSPDLQPNGRPGQKQHGIDIYGVDYVGRSVGIQCKKYKNDLTMRVVEREVENAEKFKGKITTIFIATTRDYDSILQAEVRSLSEERNSNNKFTVGLIFWEDIVSGLILNPSVFSAHYPQIQMPNFDGELEASRLIAALELGYYGGELWEYVLLIFGEFGWLAQSDSDELKARISVLEHQNSFLFLPDHALRLKKAFSEIQKGCNKKNPTESTWANVQINSERVAKRLHAASSTLPLLEGAMLRLGLRLATIYHHFDAPPKKSVRTDVREEILRLLPRSNEKRLDDAFKRALERGTGYEWAMAIFAHVRKTIWICH